MSEHVGTFGDAEETQITIGAPGVVELFIRIEWAGSEVHYVCPACQQSQAAGHTKACPLDRILRDGIAICAQYGRTFERVKLSDVQRRYVERREAFERQKAAGDLPVPGVAS